jgi:uncharacterized protein YdaT
MPWDAASFKKHNHKLSTAQSGKAARQANAILKKTGDEGLAIAVANKDAHYRGKGKSNSTAKNRTGKTRSWTGA